MKFYYNKDGELEQINTCCRQLTEEIFSYQSYKIRSLYSKQISESPLIASVPEPSTMLLLGSGLLGLVGLRRKFKK